MLSSPACLQALRVSGDTGDASVRLNWKGSEDPWMQIDLDGDTLADANEIILANTLLADI